GRSGKVPICSDWESRSEAGIAGTAGRTGDRFQPSTACSGLFRGPAAATVLWGATLTGSFPRNSVPAAPADCGCTKRRGGSFVELGSSRLGANPFKCRKLFSLRNPQAVLRLLLFGPLNPRIKTGNAVAAIRSHTSNVHLPDDLG